MQTKTNRRSFLMTSGMTALAASQVMGANDTLRVGAIGTGGRMKTLLHAADLSSPYQLVAACDVYAPHLDKENSGLTTQPALMWITGKCSIPKNWMRSLLPLLTIGT